MLQVIQLVLQPTEVTIWGDRDSATDFCAGTFFYSNAQGSSSPALSVGTYSTSTDGTKWTIQIHRFSR